MKVAVYFNFHKKCFSIKCMERGHDMYNRVYDHVDTVYLRDVTFKVSEAGRQRVLREKKKNVHATVHGTVLDVESMAQWIIDNRAFNASNGTKVAYNPYRYEKFVDEMLQPIEKATGAVLTVSEGRTMIYAF